MGDDHGDVGADDGAPADGGTQSGEPDTGVDDDDGGGGGPLLDVASAETGTVDEDGCKKIDLLFVVDNSGSMQTEQTNLIAAFPEFVDAMTTLLPAAADFHVGVTTTDRLGVNGFMDAPPFPDDPCVNTLGALNDRVTPPGGHTGYGPECGFSSGQPYMVDSENLAEEFACAAGVGVHGNGLEQHFDAAHLALTDEACNADFVRPDALLVLVMITDEDDDYSEPSEFDVGTQARAQAWFDDIVAIKAGIETNIVTLLISGGSPKFPGCPDWDINDPDTAKESDQLTAFSSQFTYHYPGNVCAAGYAQVLSDALETIAEACEDFTPVG